MSTPPGMMNFPVASMVRVLGGPPVIEAEGRAFPVETIHLGSNPAERLEASVTRAVRRALGETPGSVLVFLPGQSEIHRAARALSEARLSSDVEVVSLYGGLDRAVQDRALSAPPPGQRRVILASAVAERFPRLTLSASLSNEITDSEALFDDWLATLAGNLVLPLIDGGQRRAEARRFRSLREQRLYEYGQATLVAFQEVEDALVQERQQQRRMESLREQLALADSAYRQLRIQYVNGAVGYLEVLSALQERQELRRTLITARQELLAFRVALYRALAGGFPVTEEDENA